MKKLTKSCKVCWKEFMAYWITKHCSHKCYLSTMSETRKWKNNPAYRNWMYVTDKTKHNQNAKITSWFWEKEFLRTAKKIREEMYWEFWFYMCQHCWVNNSLRWETHHLFFRSEKPRHKNLHNPLNLLRVCIRCHNLFHKVKSTRDPYIEARKLNELFEE